MRGSASLALRKRNRGVPKAVGNSRVDAAKLEERQRAEQLRAKRLAKKEKMDRLTTGNYSIWQMSKCLGPRRSRKIGLEMQRVVEVGRGPVKSVFLVESQNYQARARKQKAKKKREVLFNAQREYDLHVQNRKKHFEALRRNKRGKIEDEDSIYVGYATKPRSGGYDRGRLFPSNKTIRASTAPSGLRVRHYKKWDRRFGTSNVIRSSDNRFLSTIESRRRRRRQKQSRDLRTKSKPEQTYTNHDQYRTRTPATLPPSTANDSDMQNTMNILALFGRSK